MVEYTLLFFVLNHDLHFVIQLFKDLSYILNLNTQIQIHLGLCGRSTSLADLNYDRCLSIIHPLYKAFKTVIV